MWHLLSHNRRYLRSQEAPPSYFYRPLGVVTSSMFLNTRGGNLFFGLLGTHTVLARAGFVPFFFFSNILPPFTFFLADFGYLLHYTPPCYHCIIVPKNSLVIYFFISQAGGADALIAAASQRGGNWELLIWGDGTERRHGNRTRGIYRISGHFALATHTL